MTQQPGAQLQSVLIKLRLLRRTDTLECFHLYV